YGLARCPPSTPCTRSALLPHHHVLTVRAPPPPSVPTPALPPGVRTYGKRRAGRRGSAPPPPASRRRPLRVARLLLPVGADDADRRLVGRRDLPDHHPGPLPRRAHRPVTGLLVEAVADLLADLAGAGPLGLDEGSGAPPQVVADGRGLDLGHETPLALGAELADAELARHHDRL